MTTSINRKQITNNNRRKENFKEKVYKIVQKIPRGNFLTYKQVAERAGHPKSWRAVGNVLNKNPVGSRRLSYGAGKNLHPPKSLPTQISKKLGAGEKNFWRARKFLAIES